MNTISLNNAAIMGSEIALAWNDNQESYLPLEALRRACPCANCQGEPDALGRVIRPQVQYGPKAFDLKGWGIPSKFGVIVYFAPLLGTIASHSCR